MLKTHINSYEGTITTGVTMPNGDSGVIVAGCLKYTRKTFAKIIWNYAVKFGIASCIGEVLVV